MGVSEFPGERTVGALINRKLKCNAGGGSFEKLVVERHIDFELRKIKKFYSNKDLSELNGACVYSTSTGKCIYNGEQYNISKPETKTNQREHPCTKLTEYELDLLNDTMILEVERLYGSDNHDVCCKNSIVYNLEDKRKTLKKDSSVSEWLRIVTKNENGKFSDEEVIVSTNLLSMNPKFYKNAKISGLLFHSRGFWKRETSGPIRKGVYGSGQLIFKGSIHSELRDNFSDKADYSSWCIFKHPNHPKHYAQINN